jgi:chromosome segregation ATPase
MFHEPGNRLAAWPEGDAALRPALEASGAEIARLAEELRRQAARLSASEAERLAQECALAETRAELELRDAAAARARAELVAQGETLARLGERLAEAQRVVELQRVELVRMRASWSWRLSAPLRAVAGRFRPRVVAARP